MAVGAIQVFRCIHHLAAKSSAHNEHQATLNPPNLQNMIAKQPKKLNAGLVTASARLALLMGKHLLAAFESFVLSGIECHKLYAVPYSF